MKRFQNVSLTRMINNCLPKDDNIHLVVKRFQNVSLTRMINNELAILQPRQGRCEKVSKCIFDKNDKQLILSPLIALISCEKVSKCIFDKNDKQLYF